MGEKKLPTSLSDTQITAVSRMPCREVGIQYPILHQEPLSRHFLLMSCGALTFASSRGSFQKNTICVSTTSRKCIIAKNRGMQEAEARRWCLQCHKRCKCHGGREIFDSWDPPSKLDRLPSCKSLPRPSPTIRHHSSPLLFLHPHPQKTLDCAVVAGEWLMNPGTSGSLRDLSLVLKTTYDPFYPETRGVSLSPTPPPLPYNSLETSD